MTAILRWKNNLLREWEVTTPTAVFLVTYSGHGLGYESVRVNGVVVAKKISLFWYVPRFEFRLADIPATVEVRVWPWFVLRAIRLRVGDEVCYTEGFWT
jgi:hypothetical protein